MAAPDRTHRITLSLTREQQGFLKALADKGLHGRNVSEVAKTLLIREIERLISEGFISFEDGQANAGTP